MLDSSSTIRTLDMRRGGRCFGHLRSEWQFDHKSRAHGFVFLDPYRTAMIFNDAAYNTEPKASSALFRGEIRQEKSLLQFLRYAMARIGDYDFHCITADHKRSGNLNFAEQRTVHRFGSIVYKICQHP